MALRLFSLCALALLIGCADTAPEGGSVAGESAVTVTPVSYEAGQSVTLLVPEMHCPFACYPKVKETLENQEGIDVESITLVEQKDEAAIDDPRIIVTLSENFDGEKTIKAIEEAGFANTQIVSAE